MTPGETAVDAVNRPVTVRVACVPLTKHNTNGGGGADGAIIVMETDQ
ncbi:hypothetical protein [Actinoplanes sp. NPDC026623]